MNSSTMDMEAIQKNTQFLGTVRLTGAVFSGIAAGIMGLTNLSGFAFYYFIYLCASALLLVKVRLVCLAVWLAGDGCPYSLFGVAFCVCSFLGCVPGLLGLVKNVKQGTCYLLLCALFCALCGCRKNSSLHCCTPSLTSSFTPPRLLT